MQGKPLCQKLIILSRRARKGACLSYSVVVHVTKGIKSSIAASSSQDQGQAVVLRLFLLRPSCAKALDGAEHLAPQSPSPTAAPRVAEHPAGERLRQRGEQLCEERHIKSEELVGQFRTFRGLALPKGSRGFFNGSPGELDWQCSKAPCGPGSSPRPCAGALGSQQEPLGTPYPEHLLE